jgi:hypothetical protein
MAQDDARAELDVVILEARSVREHLDSFALRAANHLGPGTHCSVSLRHQGTDRLAATSSARSARCDESEYASGAGPCLTAMDLLGVVLVPDVLDEGRWSTWRQTTLDEGFRSSAAVPARVREGAEIALNLYSERLDPWDRSMLVRADTYAQQMAATVALCLEVADLSREVSDLRALKALQETLDRAVGVTMARRGCTAEAALAQLRDLALAQGADLSDVAAGVLGAVTGAPDDATTHDDDRADRPSGPAADR